MTRQTLLAAIAGAAAGAGVMALVSGSRLDRAPSSSVDAIGARVSAGAAPRNLPAAIAMRPLAPPPPDATRDELLRRDELQRQEIAALRARVESMARGGPGAGAGGEGPGDPSKRKWLDPGKEELAAMAKRCEVRFDMPPVTGIEPRLVDERMGARLGVSSADREVMNGVLRDLHARFSGSVRGIYGEVTGDRAAAQTLSPEAMMREIEDKSPRGSGDEARRRIAQERAGLVPPRADPAQAPPVERSLRLMAGLGDEYERRLGEKLGPARAHELRAARDGWGQKMDMAGCPGSGSEAADDSP